MSAVSVRTGTAGVTDGAGGPQPVGAYFERMPFGRAHVLIAFALFMAFVIESWEQLALVYVSADLGDAFTLDAGRIGWVLSAVALGMIPGALVWGPVADPDRPPGRVPVEPRFVRRNSPGRPPSRRTSPR